MRVTPEKAVCRFCGYIIQEVLEIRKNSRFNNNEHFYYYWKHYDIDSKRYLNKCPSGKPYGIPKPEYGAYI